MVMLRIAFAIIVFNVPPPSDEFVMLMVANVVTYVMCDTCENFTLCVDCFMSEKYHHHPAHEFSLKNPDRLTNTSRYKEVFERLGAGRGMKHRASCDECKQVRNTRSHLSQI